MSAPNEKSGPLPSYHSGTIITADTIRLDLLPTLKQPADWLCLQLAERHPWPGFQLTTPVYLRAAAVPALAGIALMYAQERGGMMDRVVSHLSTDTRAALMLALQNAQAQDDYDAERADDAVKAAQEGA